MIVLGLESSCDETAAALLKEGRQILSSVVSSQIATHGPFGGVVPELASREHVDNISFVVTQALTESGLGWHQIDGIAATRGPGLVGALLVGLSYAKATAFSLGLPFVGVNHLEGHIASIFLDHPEAELPALSLVVSGGHTNLYRVEAESVQLLARSRDDAAGEALDKLAKRLGLGYPGGPVIERLSAEADDGAVEFSLPRFSDGSLDFSYSGLKSAALRLLEGPDGTAIASAEDPGSNPALRDFVASYQKAVIDQLIDRLERSLEQQEVRSIQVSGGVSCNGRLRSRLRERFEATLPVYFPRPALTTDNAAMIAAAGHRRLSRGERDGWGVAADANLKVGLS